jgi:hypothetical protein
MLYLAQLGDYCDRNGFWPLEWNIKMHRFSTNGRIGSDRKPICVSQWKNAGEKDWHYDYNQERFDERWEQYLKKNDLFNEMCQWLFSELVGRYKEWEYFDGHPDKDLSEIKYLMRVAGDSGEHLVLDWIELPDYGRYWLYRRYPDWGDLSYNDLWYLYRFCQEIDKVVANRFTNAEYYYADQRSIIEQDWMEEEERKAQVEAEAVGFFMVPQQSPHQLYRAPAF